jgi:hypothetical protein
LYSRRVAGAEAGTAAALIVRRQDLAQHAGVPRQHDRAAAPRSRRSAKIAQTVPTCMRLVRMFHERGKLDGAASTLCWSQRNAGQPRFDSGGIDMSIEHAADIL